MEASASGYWEIRFIITVVATIVWKHQQSSNNDSMGRSEFAMFVAIPPGEKWGDIEI